MMDDNFARLRRMNLSRCQLWHPGFPDDDDWLVSDWSNAMVGEAGETANVVKKIRRIDTGGRGREAEADRAVMVSKMGDEVADTIIYADLLMAKEHLSLWPHIVRKFNRTSEEYGFPQRLLPVQDGE